MFIIYLTLFWQADPIRICRMKRSIAVNVPTVSAATWIQRSYQSAQYQDNPDPQFSRVKDRGTLIYFAD